MDKLFDYKKAVKKLCSKSVEAIRKAEMPEEAEKLRGFTDEILSKTSPSLMFYGIYNSGKSSIINAIVGEDIAAVGDIPTTCEIAELDWNGFKIVDTPGINAKNEHTLVAKSEIGKSDVVLFVIDDMNVEEASFYNALAEVMRKEIHVIIVINQKEADYSLTDSEKIHILNSRIMELLGIASKKFGISNIVDSKYFHGIISVNAATARTSRDLHGTDAKLLFDESNLEQLIREMQDILKKCDGVKMLIPAINCADCALETAAVNIREKIKDSSEKNYYDAISRIKKQRDGLYSRLIAEGRNVIGRYKNMLLSSVSTNTSPDISGLNRDLNEVLCRGFSSADMELKNNFNIYSVNIGNLHIEKTDIALNIPKSEYDDNNNSDYLKALEEILIPKFDPYVYSAVVTPQPGIEIAKRLPAIIALITAALKNKRKKEEERQRREQEIANECARLNSETERQINEQITQIMEYNRQISSEMSKLEESYMSIVDASVDTAYEPILHKMEAGVDEAKLKSDNTQKLLLEIDNIKSELIALKSSIN